MRERRFPGHPSSSARVAHASRRALAGFGIVAVLAALTALLAGVSACSVVGDHVVTASGTTETRTFDVRDFEAVDVSNAFTVELTHGAAYAVSVTADDNVFDEIVVERDGDTLTIRLDGGTQLRGDFTLEANVTLPELRSIHTGGASRARIGDGFTLAGRLDAEASGASRIEGAIEAGSLDAELSGASSLMLTGRADEMTLDASGASTFRLSDFPVTRARIELSGASFAHVNVSESLDRVRASGASTVRYLGSPRLGDVETSGASSLAAGG